MKMLGRTEKNGLTILCRRRKGRQLTGEVFLERVWGSKEILGVYINLEVALLGPFIIP